MAAPTIPSETEDRLNRLEGDFHEIKVTLARIDERLTSTLPHLATKAELTTGLSKVEIALADKPGKVFLTAAIAILIAAYGLGLAGLAALPIATKLIR